MALAAALILPFVLLVYSTCPPRVAPYLPNDWRMTVRKSMPNVVRDNSFRILVQFSSELSDWFVYRSLREGLLSSSVLEECVAAAELPYRVEEGEQTLQEIAFDDLKQRYPQEAFQFSFQTLLRESDVRQDEVPETSVLWMAGDLVAERGTAEQIRSVLNRNSPPFKRRRSLLNGIQRANRPEFVPDLERIVAENDDEFTTGAAMRVIGAVAPPHEIVRIWSAYLMHPASPTQKKKAIDALTDIRPIPVRLKTLIAVLTRADDAAKRELLCFTYLNSNQVDQQNEIVDWVQFLQGLLDSPDSGVRRGAFLALESVIGEEWQFRWHHRIQSNCPVEPLSEDEVYDLEKMRMYTAKWLKRNMK